MRPDRFQGNFQTPGNLFRIHAAHHGVQYFMLAIGKPVYVLDVIGYDRSIDEMLRGKEDKADLFAARTGFDQPSANDKIIFPDGQNDHRGCRAGPRMDNEQLKARLIIRLEGEEAVVLFL
nr:hypothetical protein [Sphingobium sp. SJ10-10]